MNNMNRLKTLLCCEQPLVSWLGDDPLFPNMSIAVTKATPWSIRTEDVATLLAHVNAERASTGDYRYAWQVL